LLNTKLAITLTPQRSDYLSLKFLNIYLKFFELCQSLSNQKINLISRVS